MPCKQCQETRDKFKEAYSQKSLIKAAQAAMDAAKVVADKVKGDKDGK